MLFVYNVYILYDMYNVYFTIIELVFIVIENKDSSISCLIFKWYFKTFNIYLIND